MRVLSFVLRFEGVPELYERYLNLQTAIVNTDHIELIIWCEFDADHHFDW